MINYVIINGVNSNTKNGLMINELPPISKPQMRTNIEEIDGRDGDIITKLGYSAYDKTITIGLWGTSYDVNDIIAFFNKEGTITFSNEPDKYYKFTMLEQIDIERLLKFKTASITFHCQPFKYPLEETPIEIEYEYVEQDNVESANMTNTEGDTFLKIDLKGNTSQNGTPTPDTPMPINVVSGDNEVVVSGKNFWNILEAKAGTSVSTSDNKVYTLGDYEPYQSQTYPINLGVENLFETPDEETQNNVVYTINEDGTINLNGTASGVCSFVKYVELTDTKLQNEEYYTFSVNKALPSGIEIKCELYNGTSWVRHLIGGALTTNDLVRTRDINTTNGTRVKFGIGVSSGTTCNLTNLGIQIEKGSKQNSFSKYGTTPIEMCNIPNTTYQDYFTKNSGKNLYDINNEHKVIIDGNNTERYGIIVEAPNKKVSVSGTFTGDVYYKYLTNGTYSNYASFNSNSTFNVDEKIIFYAGGTSKLSDVVTKLQIEISDTPTTYEPYGTGLWCKYNAIGKILLDGSVDESWFFNNWETQTTVKKYQMSTTIPNIALKNTGTLGYICDRFTCVNASNYNADNEHLVQMNTKEILVSLKKTTADNIDEFFTWIRANNILLYFVLDNPYLSLVEDNNLIKQLDNLEYAMSYEGTTNVMQVNNDKAFLMDLKAMKKDTNEVVINNIGNTYSKPTIALEGTGDINIYLNGTQMLKATLTDKMTIDTTNLEAYNPDTMTLLNRQLVGDISKFKLDSGNNTIKMDGNLTTATITDYTRYL